MQIAAGTDLYAELPRPYRNVRSLSVYCEATTDRLRAVIPAQLQPLDSEKNSTLFEVFIAHYVDAPYGQCTQSRYFRCAPQRARQSEAPNPATTTRPGAERFSAHSPRRERITLTTRTPRARSR